MHAAQMLAERLHFVVMLSGIASTLTSCLLPLVVCTTMLLSGYGHSSPVNTSMGEKSASDGTGVWLRFA